MAFFSGTYLTTLDSKHRIVLPAKLRLAATMGEEPEFYITRGFDGCIAVLTPKQFKRILAAVSAQAGYTRAGRMLIRAVYNPGEKTKCDGQGRLLIPAPLLEEAGIKREVVITGSRDRIELWAPERYAEVQKEILRQLESNAEILFGGAASTPKPPPPPAPAQGDDNDDDDEHDPDEESDESTPEA